MVDTNWKVSVHTVAHTCVYPPSFPRNKLMFYALSKKKYVQLETRILKGYKEKLKEEWTF